MATLQNDHEVQFVLYPTNNDRTGWQPIGLPIILCVPHVRNSLGNTLANSEVLNLQVYIQEAPKAAYVSGPDHIGLRLPDKVLYTEYVSSNELNNKQLVLESLYFYRNTQAGQIEITYNEAEDGDLIQFTTATGVTSTLPYLKSANYYDLSDIKLEVESLPQNRYTLVYECQYHTRQTIQGTTTELLCIDSNRISTARYLFKFNHPGEVLQEFHDRTPALYFNSNNKSEDATIQLYRPLCDILQDAMDEQSLLKSINWVDKVPFEAIPYLSSLLGWDIPYFPNSLDNLRKTILKNTTKLQDIKGSKQALQELFNLLGLEILISNLWWSSDGKILIRPNSELRSDYASEQINISSSNQIESVLINYTTPGFGNIVVPFLHRPQTIGGLDNFQAYQDNGEIILEAWVVEQNSAAAFKLNDIVNGGINFPIGLASDPNGFATRYGYDSIKSALIGLDHGGYSKLLIGTDNKVSILDQDHGWGTPPLGVEPTSFDRSTNTLSFNFASYIDFQGYYDLPPGNKQKSVWAFARYTKLKTNVPDKLLDLQSNRFDIQILQAESIPYLAGIKNYVTPTVVDFSIEFINKIRSFNSLLNAVILTIEVNEDYETTNTLVGGDIEQRYNTNIGMLQVPPAIIPKTPSEDDCLSYDPIHIGYKQSDILYRLRKLTSLKEEYDSWRALDNRNIEYDTSLLRVPITQPAGNRSASFFTSNGQDRVISNPIDVSYVEYNPNPNSSGCNDSAFGDICPNTQIINGEFATYVSSNNDTSAYSSFMLNGPTIADPLYKQDGSTDYFYAGRIKDDSMVRLCLDSQDTVVLTHGSAITMGSGVYWTYPSAPQVACYGTAHPGHNSSTNQLFLTGGAIDSRILGYIPNNPGLTDITAQKTLLGRYYQEYGQPQSNSLHYDNRKEAVSWSQTNHLAFRRPSLDVQKHDLNFPGCRHASMFALQQDFATNYKSRPWDDKHSTVKLCGQDPDWLNCELMIDQYGDEKLNFDDENLVIIGNGFIPDIPSLSVHSGTNIHWNKVIHSIYSQYDIGHESITLDDSVCGDAITDSQGRIDVPVGTSGLPEALFSSYEQCSSHVLDFVDGYPCSTGFIPYIQPNWNNQGLSFTSASGSYLFHLDDGILVGKGLRLDAGSIAACGGVVSSISQFLNQDNVYDWETDHLNIDLTLITDENLGGYSYLIDGTITSLFEIVNNSPGSFTYVDDYRQAYNFIWSSNNGMLDITVTVEQPYVWGQPITGEIRNNNMYVAGVVTTHRIVMDSTGSIIAEGSNQFIDEVRTSYNCVEQPIDPFKIHLNSCVSDTVHSFVSDGPRFVDTGSSSFVWDNVQPVGSSGLSWVSVW